MPGTDLLDVNVWLALTDENHVHHERARAYWESESEQYLAFARVSMLGLLRLLTNRTVMQGAPFTVAEAWAAYQAFRALPEVVWIGEHDETALRADGLLAEWLDAETFSALHWTDGHLAALARTAGCRLVSFDRGFRNFRGLSFLCLGGEGE